MILKPVPNYPDYFISKKGSVFSIRKGELIKRKISISIKGRKTIILRLPQSNVAATNFISRLIALAYIPNPNNYPIVMHLDNNPLNNNIKNLKWGTQKQNMEQMIREGRGNSGRKPYKYTREVVKEMVNLRLSGKSLKDLSRIFKGSIPTISRAIGPLNKIKKLNP